MVFTRVTKTHIERNVIQSTVYTTKVLEYKRYLQMNEYTSFALYIMIELKLQLSQYMDHKYI